MAFLHPTVLFFVFEGVPPLVVEGTPGVWLGTRLSKPAIPALIGAKGHVCGWLIMAS